MALYAVNDIRSTIITLVIGIADIFVLLPAFANPVQPIYMYIIVPPVAFLNVWAIWIVINPRKRTITIHSISWGIWHRMFSRIISYNPKVCIWNVRITNSYLFYFFGWFVYFCFALLL